MINGEEFWVNNTHVHDIFAHICKCLVKYTLLMYSDQYCLKFLIGFVLHKVK